MSEAGTTFSMIGLKRLLRTLDHSLSGFEAIVGPGLRGNVSWVNTRRLQTQGAIPSDRFSSKLPTKTYDNPQNGLLKRFLADSIQACEWFVENFPTGDLTKKVYAFRQLALVGINTTYLKEVVQPLKYSSKALLECRTSRNHGYKMLFRLASCFRSIDDVKERPWSERLACIESNFFAPIDDDHLFEAFTLAKTLAAIEASLGERSLKSAAFILEGRDAIAKFVSDEGTTASVFFDVSPYSRLLGESRYADILAAYPSLAYRPRRPDIMVKYQSTIRKGLILIECKNSRSNSYITDGLYKLLGYFGDFALGHNSDIRVDGILSVPDFQDSSEFKHGMCLSNPESSSFEESIQLCIVGE